MDDKNMAFNAWDSSCLLEFYCLPSFANNTLKIEYQTTDSVLGIFKTSVKQIKFSVEHIRQARIEHKMFSSELVLQGSSLRTFRNLSGSTEGDFSIKINRQSQLAAPNLIEGITAAKG
jgi:hypothetical protein